MNSVLFLLSSHWQFLFHTHTLTDMHKHTGCVWRGHAFSHSTQNALGLEKCHLFATLITVIELHIVALISLFFSLFFSLLHE